MKNLRGKLIRFYKKIGKEVLYVRAREKITRVSNKNSFKV